MLKKTAKRNIDMMILGNDGTIQVKDTGAFWREDNFDWRYNLCLSFEENEKTLLQILYNDSQVDYSVSDDLMHYLEDRKKVSQNLGFYEDTVKSVYESFIPDHIKSELFAVINAALYQEYPYIQQK